MLDRVAVGLGARLQQQFDRGQFEHAVPDAVLTPPVICVDVSMCRYAVVKRVCRRLRWQMVGRRSKKRRVAIAQEIEDARTQGRADPKKERAARARTAAYGHMKWRLQTRTLAD